MAVKYNFIFLLISKALTECGSQAVPPLCHSLFSGFIAASALQLWPRGLFIPCCYERTTHLLIIGMLVAFKVK